MNSDSSYSGIKREESGSAFMTSSGTGTHEDNMFLNFDDDYTKKNAVRGKGRDDVNNDRRSDGLQNVDGNLKRVDYSYGYDEEDGEEEEVEGEDNNRNEADLPMADHVDTIKPVADHQDKLWKQIDILDDVKKMSEEVSKRGTFFNSAHAEALNKLRTAQLNMMNRMVDAEKVMDERLYHEVWDLNINTDNLDEEIDVIKQKLLNREQFNEVNESIDQIKLRLDTLKKTVKTVDENTKDMWVNNDFSIIE